MQLLPQLATKLIRELRRICNFGRASDPSRGGVASL